MAAVFKNAHKIVARDKGVKAAVRAKADELGVRARAMLAEHRDTGTAKIEVTSGKVDSFVSLVDAAAFPIEFGRAAYTTKDGHEVGAMQGLYIIHRAAGLR